MIKMRYSFLLVLIIGACSKSNDLPTPEPAAITLDRTTLTLGGLEASTDSFNITYTGNWTIKTDPADVDWLQLSATSGSGNTRIIVTAASVNDGESERSVQLMVSGATETTPVKLTCTQQRLPASPVYRHVFGGAADDNFNAAVATADGGVVAVGYTLSSNDDVLAYKGKKDLWIVKTDAEGNKIWSTTFGGSGDEEGDAIVATADGGYLISGYTESNDGDVSGNHGGLDAWLVKIDADGELLWQKTFGGSGLERAFGLTASADGNFVMAVDASSQDGQVVGNHSTFPDVWLVKVNSAGDKLWAKCFGGTNTEMPFSITQGHDGGVVVAGFSDAYLADGDVQPTHNGMDVWVLNVDDNGDLQWQKTFGKNNVDLAWKIISTRDGNYAIIGNTNFEGPIVNGTGHLQQDAWVIKIDNGGNLLWEKTLGGAGTDEGRSGVALPGGGLMITVNTQSVDGDVTSNHGKADAWIATLDTDGQLVHQQSYGGSEGDMVTAIVETGNNKYVFVGGTMSSDGDLSQLHGGIDGWVFPVDAP